MANINWESPKTQQRVMEFIQTNPGHTAVSAQKSIQDMLDTGKVKPDLFDVSDGLNADMNKFSQQQGADLNDAGEWKNVPTESQVSKFDEKFSTTVPEQSPALSKLTAKSDKVQDLIPQVIPQIRPQAEQQQKELSPDELLGQVGTSTHPIWDWVKGEMDRENEAAKKAKEGDGDWLYRGIKKGRNFIKDEAQRENDAAIKIKQMGTAKTYVEKMKEKDPSYTLAKFAEEWTPMPSGGFTKKKETPKK